MGTSPTTTPPLVPISFPPSSAPHLNSLASGPNTFWEQQSWVPTPTLAETPILSLEQRLEDMMDQKIAKATAFPPTLKSEARDWVATLPPKSIHSFDNFSKKFAAYFAISKRAKKTTIGLMQLTQDKDELLKDFIARFNRATLGIKDLHMSAVVTAMMNGTHSHPFKMSLSKNPPDTMHELLRRGDKYVDAEEAFFITKGMKDRKELESNKRKARDEPRPREDRGKQK
ncbi:Uncharacterized protein Adt_49058 [Abeliophyllum distichum]|uniref:Retrotransposon gag domain-containing protein n=1 Tax=Abeliophyllum distichum TaxID=126358 RepID=A0ABD1NPV9_9LAMI